MASMMFNVIAIAKNNSGESDIVLHMYYLVEHALNPERIVKQNANIM